MRIPLPYPASGRGGLVAVTVAGALAFVVRARRGKVGRPIGSTGGKVDAQGNLLVKMSGNTRDFPDSKMNNASYAINRLRSNAYEIDRSTGEIIGVKNERVRQLYDDVLEGRKKPNAAAVEAGFRPLVKQLQRCNFPKNSLKVTLC